MLAALVVLLDGGSQLLHGRRRLLQRTGLLFGAGRQVDIAGGNLAGGRGHGLRAATHLLHDPDQAVVHVLQRLQQLAAFVARAHLDVRPQIAGRHRAGDLHRLAHGPCDGTGDQDGAQNAGHHTDCAQHEHQAARGMDVASHLGAAALHQLFLQIGQGIDRLLQRIKRRQRLAVEDADGLVLLPLVHQFDHLAERLHILDARLTQARQQGPAFGQVDQLVQCLQRFIDGKSASFQDLGVRVVDGNESVIVDFVDPTFKDAKLKVGDKITLLNGKKVSNVTEFGDALKTFKDLTKVSAQIQRDNAWIEENILAPKPVVKKAEPKKVPLPESKKESYLQAKGFKFDNDLRLKEITRGSLAEQSGLKAGDRLIQIDQVPVERVSEADSYLAKARNREVSLLFDRDDFQFFVTLKR